MTEVKTFSIEKADDKGLIDHSDKSLDFSNNDEQEIINTIKELDELAKEGGTIDGKKIKDTEYYKSLVNSIKEIQKNKKNKQNEIIADTVEKKENFKEEKVVGNEEEYIVSKNGELVLNNNQEEVVAQEDKSLNAKWAKRIWNINNPNNDGNGTKEPSTDDGKIYVADTECKNCKASR